MVGNERDREEGGRAAWDIIRSPYTTDSIYTRSKKNVPHYLVYRLILHNGVCNAAKYRLQYIMLSPKHRLLWANSYHE